MERTSEGLVTGRVERLAGKVGIQSDGKVGVTVRLDGEVDIRFDPGGKDIGKVDLRLDGMECGGGSTGCSPASRRLRLYLLHVRIMSPSNGGLTRMQMLDARLYPAWQLYKLVSYSNYKFSDLSTYA